MTCNPHSEVDELREQLSLLENALDNMGYDDPRADSLIDDRNAIRARLVEIAGDDFYEED